MSDDTRLLAHLLLTHTRSEISWHLKSESRCWSNDSWPQIYLAPSIRITTITIAGWAGFAVSHLRCHHTQLIVRSWLHTTMSLWVTFSRRVIPLTLEPLRSSKQLNLRISLTKLCCFRHPWRGGSAWKPLYGVVIWLPSHIRTDSSAVLLTGPLTFCPYDLDQQSKKKERYRYSLFCLPYWILTTI